MRNVQRGIQVGAAVLGAVLLLAAVNSLFDISLGAAEDLVSKWSYNVVLLGSSLMVLARAYFQSRDRLAWTLIGVGMLLWTIGNIYYSVVLWDMSSIPVPSVSDAFWVIFYPFIYAGLFLLLRARLQSAGKAMWLDGLVGALAVGAVGTELVIHTILEKGVGSGLELATNLSYPVADVVLVAIVVAAISVTRWNLRSSLSYLGAALVVFAVMDSIYLVQVWEGTWAPGNVLEGGWPLAMLLMAVAASRPPMERADALMASRRLLALVSSFALVALGVLVYDHFDRVNAISLLFASAAIGAVVIRLVLTFNENLRMIRKSQHEAATDSLTGLGNRRRLMSDLEKACASGEQHALLLFDLDGFKNYNDTFGHPAGDALLARLGQRLHQALPSPVGTYRMGGDEFCVLAPLSMIELDLLSSLSQTALTEAGEGFSIGASMGSALMPFEETRPSDALRLADGRMYGQKSDVRLDVYRQSTEVLLQALKERDPILQIHVHDVAGHAVAVAAEMGIEGQDLQNVRMAAELHDVGKVAIPDAILNKPAPLNDSEWDFMRQHTVIGQRILGAAPALAEVGRLVRSSHERWDGAGYPDQLSDKDIPLGARIVAVCDAFDAMVADRPYRSSVPAEDALSELKRCAGTQFDPGVVETFVELFGSSDPTSDEGRAAAS